VVGAQLEPDHLVDFVIARGQDEDRRLRAGGAESPQQLEAVHPRQSNVEDDEVGRLVRRALEGLLVASPHRHRVALLLEGVLDAAGNGELVFDDEDRGAHEGATVHPHDVRHGRRDQCGHAWFATAVTGREPSAARGWTRTNRPQELAMTTLMTASTAPPPVPGRATGATRPSAVRFDGVTRHYGATVALDAIDLEIAPGETIALLGPNGAGKSTAIWVMRGLLAPTSGNVRVLDDEPHTAVRSGAVGAMLQESGLPMFARVGELIELVRHLSPRSMPTDAVLARAGLTALADRPTESLSGGETQRVRFAMAIAGAPDLLFLDEPTVAMDVESRRSFWSDMRAFAAE